MRNFSACLADVAFYNPKSLMNAEIPITNAEVAAAHKPLVLKSAWHVIGFQVLRRSLLSCMAVLASALASYWIISQFVVQTVQVVGGSMQPTLHHSERFLLNRWVYYVQTPQVGDIVVLRDPADRLLSVKRIIARPGDTVRLAGGKVYVNGRELAEPYLAPRMPTYPAGELNEQSWQCQTDHYLVLGDNRMNSADSRCYGTRGTC